MQVPLTWERFTIIVHSALGVALVSLMESLMTVKLVGRASSTVTGQLFFASSNDLTTLFEYTWDPKHIVIDMTGSHVWDTSTIAALDAIVTEYNRLGEDARLVGMNEYPTA